MYINCSKLSPPPPHISHRVCIHKGGSVNTHACTVDSGTTTQPPRSSEEVLRVDKP